MEYALECLPILVLFLLVPGLKGAAVNVTLLFALQVVYVRMQDLQAILQDAKVILYHKSADRSTDRFSD